MIKKCSPECCSPNSVYHKMLEFGYYLEKIQEILQW